MLHANRLLFSRTKGRDYRWIYNCPELSEDNLQIMQNELQESIARLSSISSPDLIYKEINSGILVYTFSKSSRKDCMNRTIYYLAGYYFKDFDAQFLKQIAPYFLFFLNNHIEFLDDSNFEPNENGEENKCVEFEFNVNSIVDACREIDQDSNWGKELLSCMASHPLQLRIFDGENGRTICSNSDSKEEGFAASSVKETGVKPSAKPSEKLKNEQNTHSIDAFSLLDCLKKFFV